MLGAALARGHPRHRLHGRASSGPRAPQVPPSERKLLVLNEQRRGVKPPGSAGAAPSIAPVVFLARGGRTDLELVFLPRRAATKHLLTGCLSDD